MLILTATTDTLTLITGSGGSVDVYVSYVDLTTATVPTPGRSSANITTATTTTILSAPAASTSRTVKTLVITNRHASTSNAVRVVYDANGTQRYLTASLTLAAGESVVLDGDVFRVLDGQGRERNAAAALTAQTGTVYDFFKIGTATEAAGVYYSHAKDGGYPGAAVPGSPGVNGWWTDARTATNAANPAGATQTGSFVIPNPVSGSLHLQVPQISTGAAGTFELVDLLWYNTGIVVTTTTAQAIAMPGSSVAARDINGTANGEGVMAGVYVTTVTTNAGAITNMTLDYTSSDGTPGRTATMAAFPITAVVGTMVPFQLQAGDRGIRTIEGITLGTSLVTGAISVVLYRKLTTVTFPVAYIGYTNTTDNAGSKIWPGTAVWPIFRGAATTAANITGSVRIVER